jgi:hypothetical protein
VSSLRPATAYKATSTAITTVTRQHWSQLELTSLPPDHHSRWRKFVWPACDVDEMRRDWDLPIPRFALPGSAARCLGTWLPPKSPSAVPRTPQSMTRCSPGGPHRRPPGAYLSSPPQRRRVATRAASQVHCEEPVHLAYRLLAKVNRQRLRSSACLAILCGMHTSTLPEAGLVGVLHGEERFARSINSETVAASRKNRSSRRSSS